MRQNFAGISSQAKVRNPFAEFRENFGEFWLSRITHVYKPRFSCFRQVLLSKFVALLYNTEYLFVLTWTEKKSPSKNLKLCLQLTEAIATFNA